MKCKKFNLAIIMMVVAAIISVAVVSCKKEDNRSLAGQVTPKPAFTPPQVDDMNVYLESFKEKMLASTKGNDETLSLDEAAWHLSSLANYDFGRVNVEFDNLRFDTLYAQINVTNEMIQMSDLAQAYEDVTTKIDKFYQSLMLDNKHFRFIDVSINETGEVTISLITTFICGSKYLSDTCYYYGDEWLALEDCVQYFDEYYDYPVQNLGTTELKRVLNLIDSHPPTSSHSVYFTTSSSKTFYFYDYIDPYGSPSLDDSRLFASASYFHYNDIKHNLCYYLDSYLGLGYQYLPMDKIIISWDITLVTGPVSNERELHDIQRHELKVKYGEINLHGSEPGAGDL